MTTETETLDQRVAVALNLRETVECPHCMVGLTPPYSTDINAAMRVVDAMRERGWIFSCCSGTRADDWASRFSRNDQWGKEMSAGTFDGGALPEAICRAALNALERARAEESA